MVIESGNQLTIILEILYPDANLEIAAKRHPGEIDSVFHWAGKIHKKWDGSLVCDQKENYLLRFWSKPTVSADNPATRLPRSRMRISLFHKYLLTCHKEGNHFQKIEFTLTGSLPSYGTIKRT